MSDELRHFRVSFRMGGAPAEYVSDERAETVLDAVVAAMRRRRSGDLKVGQLYQFVVQDVDKERERAGQR